MKKSFAVFVLLLGVCFCASGQNVSQQGFLDVADCHAFSGWAADTQHLNTSINVRLFTDGVFSRSILANLSRPDVATALGDNGLHGFSFQVPVGVMDNQPHSIKVTFDDGIKELSNSPRSVTCAPLSLVAVGGQPTPTPTPTPTPLQVTSFDIRPRFSSLKISNQTTTDPTLLATAQFDQTPAFFRMGEVTNLNQPELELRGIPWKTYTPGMTLTFRLSTTRPYGVRNVFIRVNSVQSEVGVSRPKGDSITFAPASTKEFVLTGSELSAFLSRASSLGYRSTFSGPTIVGTYPCNIGLRVLDYNTLEPAVTDSSRNFTESYASEIFRKSGEDRFLNPFWTVREISIGELLPHTSTELIRVSGPTSGRQDDLSRTIFWQYTYSYLRPNPAITCVSAEGSLPGGGFIKSITLEGPSDRPATDAFRTPN